MKTAIFLVAGQAVAIVTNVVQRGGVPTMQMTVFGSDALGETTPTPRILEFDVAQLVTMDGNYGVGFGMA